MRWVSGRIEETVANYKSRHGHAPEYVIMRPSEHLRFRMERGSTQVGILVSMKHPMLLAETHISEVYLS